MTVRINMWSSPRNLSTAMMYAWRQRTDTTVVDEPLYAHYLRVSGRDHPGRDDVLASQDQDGEAVVRDVMYGAVDTPVAFFKQMAKHHLGLDRSFLADFRNILLTRDPHDMLTSFQVHITDATIDDTGFPELIEILDSLIEAGEEPVVVETTALLADPAGVLYEVCRHVGVEFDPAMLSWPPGPKPEDGIWAKYWYDGVHRSTGWQSRPPKDGELLPALEPVLATARPMYERLVEFSVG